MEDLHKDMKFIGQMAGVKFTASLGDVLPLMEFCLSIPGCFSEEPEPKGEISTRVSLTT